MHRNLHRPLAALLVTLAGLGLTPVLYSTPAMAATTQFVVTTDADVVDGGDGLLSLREAFTAAADLGPSEIVLPDAADLHLTHCAATPEDANASGDLDAAASSGVLTITGHGATIDQDCPAERVLYSPGPLTLRDLTITGGTNDTDMTNNSYGSAVLGYSSVTIEDSLVTDNHAFDATVYAYGAVDVARSTFRANTTPNGATAVTMANTSTHLTVNGSTITDNTGGSAFVSTGDLIVRDSTFTANIGTQPNSFVPLLYANLSLRLEHATVVGNSPGLGTTLFSPQIHLESSVLVNGPNGECHANNTVTSHGGNVLRDTSCGTPLPTDQTGVTDAGLGVLADNGGPTLTQLPTIDSPLVDAVPAAACTTTIGLDQRGRPRHSRAGCDAGAVEVQFQPDGAIRVGSGAFRGDGIHNLSTVGQSRRALSGRGTTARFQVRVDNDGDVADTIHIRGARGRGQVTARYFAGGHEVTDSVVAGRAIPLPAGGSDLVGVRIRVAPNAPHGLLRHFTLRLTSAQSGEDRVRADVQVR